MEWSEFALRLGRELKGLDRDTILIVRERDESRHYVQAMREPDRLYAEAVGNNFLDGALLLTPADEEVMSEVGWRPPADPAPRNWWTELPPQAGNHDYSRLAEMMVTALRDVQGVRRPSDLVYESFHRHGTGLVELADFGIDAADPGRVSERREADEDLEAFRLPSEPVPGLNGTPSYDARWNEGGYGAGAAQDPLEDSGAHRAYLDGGAEAPATGGAYVDAVGPPEGFNGARLAGRRHREPVPADTEPIEERLADAKQRGDHVTYFELLLGADILLPSSGHAVEHPGVAEFVTTTIGTTTYVMVFTSRQAMAQSLGTAPGLVRQLTFGELAGAWPNPDWSLAVNAGLPSEVHLDAAAVARLDGMRRTAQRASAVDAVVSGVPRQAPEPAMPLAAPVPVPEPQAPPPPAPAPAVPRVPLRPPHGTRLWRDEDTAVAVYDSALGSWTSVLTGTRGPHAD